MKKLYFIRHGQTNFNIQGRSDEIGEAHLTEIGLEEANVLVHKLQGIIDFGSTMIYCSPLPRAFATIKPYLLTQLSQKETQELEDKHNKYYLLYKDLVDRDSLFDHIHNSQENQILTYKINNNINIDFRITEWFSVKEFHKTIMKEGVNYFPSRSYVSQRGKGLKGEGSLHIRDRINDFIIDIKKEKYSNILCIGHAGSGRVLRKYFEDFNFDIERENFRIRNTEILKFYL